MEITVGIAGKPNAGKSTLFSAMTGTTVAIGDYQFTTTETTRGVSYIVTKCPHLELKHECSPKHGKCFSGRRYVPVDVLDIPGLIEGSGQGKGMGNQFMDSIRGASAMINLINPFNQEKERIPVDQLTNEAQEVENEIIIWFASRLGSEWEKFCRKVSHMNGPLEEKLIQKVGFFGIGQPEIRKILNSGNFPELLNSWGNDEMTEFSRTAMTVIRPMERVVNKGDLIHDTSELINSGLRVISADYELSIQRAYSLGLIIDMDSIEPTPKANEKQSLALEKIRNEYRAGKLVRIQDVLTDLVKNRMENIVVYPVYDDGKWCDKDGNILPDAFIMKKGETALDLAFAVHTDIGNGFIRAVDGRTRMILGKTHELKDSDVIRVVSR
ncbi:MAG: 50S ribosome-binding GTPase [Candidatus Thermoplasmatota archaeon]|jgi:ribosome-binding ATPase YchF (GTP1/OBG family)|nr:50S ribosome-binding GTPase [Candidatus Thermoplasmatota archaeon]